MGTKTVYVLLVLLVLTFAALVFCYRKKEVREGKWGTFFDTFLGVALLMVGTTIVFGIVYIITRFIAIYWQRPLHRL